MSRWTPAELAALKNTTTYLDFARESGYSKSYNAWEVKRRRVVSDDPEAMRMSPLLIHRAMLNNIKLARQMIRLRHSIEADDELAEIIPRIKTVLEEQAQSGHVSGLTFEELRSLLYGT